MSVADVTVARTVTGAPRKRDAGTDAVVVVAGAEQITVTLPETTSKSSGSDVMVRPIITPPAGQVRGPFESPPEPPTSAASYVPDRPSHTVPRRSLAAPPAPQTPLARSPLWPGPGVA